MKEATAGRRIWSVWTGLTDGFLCLLLLIMIGLACLQIFLRTFFSSGFLWADPLLRYLVLWSGMLGAVVATREGKHIAIDIITYLAPEGAKTWIRLAINLFSVAVSVVLTWAACIFVRNEAMYGSSSLLSVPSWIWNLVFPLAFGMIAFHFLVALLMDFSALINSRGRRQTAGVPDNE
jgi:TRAP-type C4-dicarboxylate transport system permease small subunit